VSARNSRTAKAARRAVRAYTKARKCGHCTGCLRDGEHGWGVYHDPGCPVLSGAVDPGADGRRAAAEASEKSGIPVVHPSFTRHTQENVLGFLPSQPAGPRAIEIVQWFIGRMKGAPMEFCPHIDADAPPAEDDWAHWAAWDRERLLCEACFMASQQRVNSTREDATCDYCREYVPLPEREGEPRLYAVVKDLGPVTLHFGLCPSCWQADQEAA
jgi:hypothetical protein